MLKRHKGDDRSFSDGTVRVESPFDHPPLRVGIIATPDFTLMSFSCLIEFLRLAADERDYSRQIYCSWSLLSEDRQPLTSSCGLQMLPDGDFCNLKDYDYIVVHGGVLHSDKTIPDSIYQAVQNAVDLGIPVIGLCTGQFLLAELGFLDNKQCAVHFSLEPTLRQRYPDVFPVTDKPVVEDGAFITCPGGLATIGLASRLVARHCGKSRVGKVLHYFMAERMDQEWNNYREEQTFAGEYCQDRRVVKAIGFMRQSMTEQYSIVELAFRVGTTKRELTRLFSRYLNMPPAEYWRNIRLSHARWMVLNTDCSIAQIAYECGFTDSSHLIRWFRKLYALTPAALRRTSKHLGGL